VQEDCLASLVRLASGYYNACGCAWLSDTGNERRLGDGYWQYRRPC
jgi:hypothetical protein